MADPTVEVNGCLGWTEFDRRTLRKALRTIQNRVRKDLPLSDRLVAIAYPFVSEANLEKEAMVSALNFYHVVGFSISEIRPPNWRGEGDASGFL